MISFNIFSWGRGQRTAFLFSKTICNHQSSQTSTYNDIIIGLIFCRCEFSITKLWSIGKSETRGDETQYLKSGQKARRESHDEEMSLAGAWRELGTIERIKTRRFIQLYCLTDWRYSFRSNMQIADCAATIHSSGPSPPRNHRVAPINIESFLWWNRLPQVKNVGNLKDVSRLSLLWDISTSHTKETIFGGSIGNFAGSILLTIPVLTRGP